MVSHHCLADIAIVDVLNRGIRTGFDAKEYIEQTLQPTLIKGLIALCKEKPSSKKLETITWLADWLAMNNPNKAKIVPESDNLLDPVEIERASVLVDDLEGDKRVSRLQRRIIVEGPVVGCLTNVVVARLRRLKMRYQKRTWRL